MQFEIQHRVHGPRLNFFQWCGLNLFAIENEKIRVVVWPEHGADIIEFRHKTTDLDVLWKNPRVWPPNKNSLDQNNDELSSFYDTFHGGWFISMPTGFFPTTYYGAPIGAHGEMQSLHWKVGTMETSAELVTIRVIGRSVRTPLRLEREWSLKSGSMILQWREELFNESEIRLPVVWLHHPSFGGPFIRGSELRVPARTLVVPHSDVPELSQLTPGYEGQWPLAPEQNRNCMRDCSRVPDRGSQIEHDVMATDLQIGWSCLWNKSEQLGFGMRWDEAFFPWVWSWVSTSGFKQYPIWGQGHTITAQPSTSPIQPFERLVETNQLKWIEPGGTLGTSLSTGFCTKPDEVFPLLKI